MWPSDWITCVPRGWLECYAGWAVRRQLEEEGERVGSELLDQPLLEAGERPLVDFGVLEGGEYLGRGQVEVLPEGETKHVEVLPAIPEALTIDQFISLTNEDMYTIIPEGRQHVSEHLSVLEVLRVNEDDAVDGIDMGNVVHEVSLS